MHAYGNAPAVVDGGDRVVLVDNHIDAAAIAGEVLVDGVVDHFPHQVVQPPRIGAPDVHPGPFADGFEALQGGDIPSVVPRFRVQLVVLCHTNKSTKIMPAFLGFWCPGTGRWGGCAGVEKVRRKAGNGAPSGTPISGLRGGGSRIHDTVTAAGQQLSRVTHGAW